MCSLHIACSPYMMLGTDVGSRGSNQEQEEHDEQDGQEHDEEHVVKLVFGAGYAPGCLARRGPS